MTYQAQHSGPDATVLQLMVRWEDAITVRILADSKRLFEAYT